MILPSLSLSRYLESTFLGLASNDFASLKSLDSETHTFESLNLSVVYQLKPMSVFVSPFIVVLIRFGLLLSGTLATVGFLSSNSISHLFSPAVVSPEPLASTVFGAVTVVNHRAALITVLKAIDRYLHAILCTSHTKFLFYNSYCSNEFLISG